MSLDRENVGAPPTSSVNTWLVLALLLLSGGLVYQTWFRNGAALTATGGRPNGEYVPRDVVPRGELTSAEAENITVIQRASPSVVFIRTKGFQPYLLGGVKEQELSSGTGFVWDKQGHVVTNLHVVEDALTNSNSTLEVQFDNKEVVDAEVVGGVREHDIAILRVSASADRLTPISLGTSDDLQVGQNVLAIGSPFGFDQTLSTGVIGGLNRSVPTEGGKGLLDGLIQTDAAINPGNSGGPLLDSAGRMIGVNTAIVSPTGSYSGLGFAVSVSSVISSVNLVLEESTGPQTPVLGISILAPEQAAQLGIPQEILDRGLFIKQLDPSGPAADTALRSTQQRGYQIYLGDQIAAIDEEPVTTVDKLQAVLKTHQVGDVVTLKIFRGDLPGTIEITLQARKLIF